MPNEANTIIVSRSVEEDKDPGGIVQDAFAAEMCPAKCPTCQQWMRLLLKCALLSVLLVSSPALIRRGMRVFTIVRMSMNGFNPCLHRMSR